MIRITVMSLGAICIAVYAVIEPTQFTTFAAIVVMFILGALFGFAKAVAIFRRQTLLQAVNDLENGTVQE